MKSKAASKREQSQDFLSFAEREQTRESFLLCQGLRSPKKRSLPYVNEHFEGKHNAAIRLYIQL